MNLETTTKNSQQNTQESEENIMLLILEIYLTINAWKKGYKAWALLPWAACVLIAIMIVRAQGPNQTDAFNFALILPDLGCVAVLALMNAGRAKADSASPLPTPGSEVGQEMESPTSVLGATAKNLILVLILGCSLIGALTSYAQDEPVLMRMNLEPGETYRYQAKFEFETSEQGEEIGIMERETAVGTVVLRPKDAGPSDSVNVNLDTTISFVEKTPSPTTASAEQED